MGIIEVALPAMGEGIIEAIITRWFVKEGEYVDVNQPLVEVATDKVDSEISSSVSGIIHKVIFKEGEIPKIGEVLVIIKTESVHAAKAEFSIQNTTNKKAGDFNINWPNKSLIEHREELIQHTDILNTKSNGISISPFIRLMAKNREINFEELMQINGTGQDGRITKNDLNKYIRLGRQYRPKNNSLYEDRDINSGIQLHLNNVRPVMMPGEEIIEMDHTRKLIASHMVNSKRISPHVTSMIEIDVTSIVQWKKDNKDQFINKYGIKLTYTPLIVMAVVKALKDFPGINVSVSGENVILKKYFNIGIATALPDGNLIVPVIKEADKCSFVKVVSLLSDLAERARKSKLEPFEIKGGTFTITNLGPYDNISGIPIINQPEVAILAVGTIKRKPWVVINKGQETIGIRDIMILSLSYDHRVVDGALGGSFLRAVGSYLTSDLPEF
jgi:2-oxoglutarate dehydrogenase E2 component (dihydrolipoamide succinyltransferase)